MEISDQHLVGDFAGMGDTLAIAGPGHDLRMQKRIGLLSWRSRCASAISVNLQRLPEDALGFLLEVPQRMTVLI